MCVQIFKFHKFKFRVFDHVKPPKNARIVKKKKKKSPNENNRALRLSGLGPNKADSIGSSHHRCSVPNNNKQHRFNRVLCTIGARSLIKAASSDGRDLAPGSPPTGGFRKTGNVKQYAFKNANIEVYVKVI